MPFGFGKGGGRDRRGSKNTGHRGRRRRFNNRMPENCICPSCKVTRPHHPGVPCFQTTCPLCGAAMTRQFGTSVISTEQKQTTRNMLAPSINIDCCIGCGLCVDVCPIDAISIVHDKANIDESRCYGCRACLSVCPKSAIV